MKHPLPALVVIVLLGSSPSALCAPEDNVVTLPVFEQMTPAELAQRIHADGRTWIARTIAIGTPDAVEGIGGTLYAMPEPALGRLCRVDVLSVAADRIKSAGGEIEYRLGKASRCYICRTQAGRSNGTRDPNRKAPRPSRGAASEITPSV